MQIYDIIPQALDVSASPTFAGLTITGNSVFGLNSSVFQPAADSTTFFQILDADGGTPIFNVDSTNERIGIGTATPAELFQVKDGHFAHYATSGDYGVILDSGTVAHGMTGIGGTYANINTNTYGYLAPANTNDGGLTVAGFRDNDGSAFVFNAHAVGPAAATPIGAFQAWESSGTNRTAIGTADTIFSFRAGSTNKVFIKGNGLTYFGGNISTSLTDPMVVVSRTSTGSGSSRGFLDDSSINKSAAVGYASFDSRPTTIGSNNYDHIVGFQSRPLHTSSGTMSRLTAFQGALRSTGGAITRATNYEARDLTGGGTATDQYGLYIEALTAGTANHGIHLLNNPDGGSISTASNIDFTIMPGGTGNFGVGISSPSYRFSIGSTDASDQIGIYHDNSNAYMTWNDGILYLTTDEGTNTDTIIQIMGKGTGRGQFSVWNQADDARVVFQPFTDTGLISYLGDGAADLDIQNDANIPVFFFGGCQEGQTQEVKIKGWRTGDGVTRKSLEIGVGVDAADTASFDGLSNYWFDGNIQISSGNEHRFYDVGNSNYVGFEAPALTGNQIWVLPDADGSANDIIKTDGSGNLAFVTPTVDIPITMEVYDPSPARGSVSEIHGGFLSLATAQPLNSVPTNIVVSKGIGKIVVVVNAGSDLAGDITVTGTSVDRDTGATTGADTDTITVDALTTDNSDTDTNGNPRYSFTGAYITSKWFTGSVTLSTTNLTLTDVDVYHCSFEQFNDNTSLTLNTFDANIYTTNVAAEFDAYLYALEVTGDKCDISRQASLNVGADGETAIANKYWRLRRGSIAKALDGSTDGIWVDIHYSNSPAYVEDVSMKVWATKSQTLTLAA